MSENEQSGNRWEAKAAESGEHVEDAPSEAPAEMADAPAEVPVAVPPAVPADPTRSSRLPAWVSKRGLVASAAVAAIFLGGGGVGYAIGAQGGGSDDRRPFPARFDGDGFRPGQPPGGGQGSIPGPQQFQGQSDDGSGSDSGAGTSS